MKVCLLCGETYSDPIDFCFRDGEVLASAESRQTPSARVRTESYTTTPGLVTAAAMVADDEPEVTRANRRALMRAAAAAYVVTDPAPAAEVEPDTNGSAVNAPAPLLVSPLDEGMPEMPWPLEEDLPEDEPPRGSMFAAALIGALVVVAAVLGAGLLVLVGLGQRDSLPTTGAIPVSDRPAARSVRKVDPPPAYDVAPTPRPVAHVEKGAARMESEPAGASAEAADFLVVLGSGGGQTQPLVLHVDGVRAGPVPVTVRLTPGEHTFRITTEPAGTAMLEVRRTVESPSDPAVAPTIDLSE